MSPKYKKMVTKFSPISPDFYCEYCVMITSNKKDFNKHLLTAKHLKRSLGDKIGDIGDKKKPIMKCNKCNKIYKSRNGLWKHNKICKNENENENENEKEILNQESELMNIIIKEHSDFTPFYISNADFIDNITSLYSILRRAICVSCPTIIGGATTRRCSESTG